MSAHDDAYGLAGPLRTMRSYPIYHDLRARAPGLTVEAVDSLLRDAWVAGFQAGVEDLTPQVDAAEARVREYAFHVNEAINRIFSHVVLGLRRDRRKKTIKDEREWMERQAVTCEQGIAALRAAQESRSL